MNLTVFLLRRKFSDLATVPAPDGYAEVSAAANPGKAIRLLLKQNNASTPPWVRWLSDLGIQLAGASPQNQSSSGILLIKLKTSKTRSRVFAVTFGHGWSSITADMFEGRYGIGCASRLVDPERVVHMRSLRPEINPLEVSAFRAASGKPDEFGLDLGVDVFSTLAGRPPSAAPIVASFVAGTDCLRIRGWKGRFSDLRKALKETLKVLRSPVAAEFKFLDDIQRVREKKIRRKLHLRLHRQLLAQAQAGTSGARQVVFALPLEAEINGTSFVLSVGPKDLPLAVPSLTGLETLIRAEGLTAKNLEQAKFGYDDGDGMTIRAPLSRFLDGEVNLSGINYLFLRGIWLLPGANYVKGLDDRIASLPAWPLAGVIPAWPMGMREDAFNVAVAASGPWLLQDQQFFYRGTSKIEPCDILTDRWEFVHVKCGKRSAVWNHLFSQALVSARLMKNDPSYRAEIQARYGRLWPSSGATPGGGLSVVLAMAGKTKGTLQVARLPLFSKIAFVEMIRSLRLLDMTVYLSVIPRI